MKFLNVDLETIYHETVYVICPKNKTDINALFYL